jgi:hypothetical protein
MYLDATSDIAAKFYKVCDSDATIRRLRNNCIMQSILFIIGLLSTLGVVGCSKILFVPLLNTSQFLEMDGFGRVLKQRGHDLYVVMGSKASIPKQAQETGYKRLDYRQANVDRMKKDAEEAALQHGLAAMPQLSSVFTQLCADMLADEQLLHQIVQMRFDIAIVNNLGPMAPCPFILAQKANLTYIAYSKSRYNSHT